MLDSPEVKDLYNETIVGCDNMKCVVKKWKWERKIKINRKNEKEKKRINKYN